MQRQGDEGSSAMDLNHEQRLKAATYYSIKQISKEVEEDMEVSFNPQILALLNESLHRQTESWAIDLENFAKHAKRTDVNLADVRLLARRNNTLLAHIDSLIEEMNATETENKQQKDGKKERGKKRKATSEVDPDEC
ncbi:centromere protein S [Aplysia californica]|uniref:Centromere protein S n=1 Tax=Aplysia californica TaxID=6500 RepID=A0ABM0K649_APLCA|nr:centromere protein S [Aplysia californica]